MRYKISQLIILGSQPVEKLLQEWNDIHKDIKDLEKLLKEKKDIRTKTVNKLLPKMIILKDYSYEYENLLYTIVQYTAGKNIPYKKILEFVMERVNKKLMDEIREYKESVTTLRTPKPPELRTRKSQREGQIISITDFANMIIVLKWGIYMLKKLMYKITANGDKTKEIK